MARRREAITLHEAAERLGVHYMTAYRYVRTGRLPAVRDGAQWMIDPQDLDRMREPARPGRGSAISWEERAERLAARMVAGDEAGAWTVIESALASGAEPADVHLNVLAAALRDVGEGWAGGRLSIADEHRAATIAHRLIGRLGPAFARRGRTRGTVVVGAPAGEHHGLPSAVVRDLLRGEGFEVLDLGADTPVESFVESAHQADRLAAVAIGVTLPGQDAVLRSTIRALRRARVVAPVLVGGAGTRDEAHALQLGADGWTGHDGSSAVAAVVTAVGRAG
ncbi:MAG TPA: B12-binding domain-containing protein [Acidimicrobiales bacterium]|nr:B12-binding domain-containing protein [Acidimicrobiales bacterium]